MTDRELRKRRYNRPAKHENPHGRHEIPERNRELRQRGRSGDPVRRSRKPKPSPGKGRSERDAGRVLRNVLMTILVVAAVSVLVASLKMPVIRVYGDAMVPLVSAGDTVVGIRDGAVSRGDVVGVYFGNKLLTKRCIAVAGQKVNIDEAGNVSVDGVTLDEPYAVNKAALAETADIDMPFLVPQDEIFVLGDNRSNPADSRSTDVGCFKLEDVCGRLMFRIWPLPVKLLK